MHNTRKTGEVRNGKNAALIAAKRSLHTPHSKKKSTNGNPSDGSSSDSETAL
jgi:hypothetical protein